MADRVDIQNVLTQMRMMQLQSQNANLSRLDQADRTQLNAPVNNDNTFSDLVANALNSVNELQKESGQLQNALERGVEGVTLTEAMIASQKASVAFEAVSEARNKLVSAYEKIMNMPI